MSVDNVNLVNPKCVATTTDGLLETTTKAEPTPLRPSPRKHGSNFFREAHFSGDGTTIVTHNEDHSLKTFVLPPNLLDESEHAHPLQPYSTYASPSVVRSYTIYPHYNLQDLSTTLILCASADVPISLRNALQFDTVHASYQSINASTEQYASTTALTFTRDGRHFIAGSHNRLDVFDCSTDGSGPVLTHRTAAGKKASGLFNPLGASRKGLVSALSISGDGVLASGTMLRNVALYANEGSGECLTTFSLATSPNRSDPANGSGITHLKWSPCGTYLLIAERQSEGVHVYDVRNMLRGVSRLSGRKANTTQRLGIDVVPTAGGYEVWGGGTDGCVRMWSNPGQKEGMHAPDAEAQMHREPVSSAVWHPGGAVLATCSGQRTPYPAIDESEGSDGEEGSVISDADSRVSETDKRSLPPIAKVDNTLKLWTI